MAWIGFTAGPSVPRVCSEEFEDDDDGVVGDARAVLNDAADDESKLLCAESYFACEMCPAAAVATLTAVKWLRSPLLWLSMKERKARNWWCSRLQRTMVKVNAFDILFRSSCLKESTGFAKHAQSPAAFRYIRTSRLQKHFPLQYSTL